MSTAEKKQVLGAWKHLSREERVEKIQSHPCTPTSDVSALQLLRVIWLHHVHQTFKLIHPWKNVLDLGCHDGFVTRWLVDEPDIEHLVGIDLCGESIDWAKKIVGSRQHPTKARYIHGDWITTEEITLGVFDAIVCFEFVEHLDDLELVALFRRLDAWLAPGGVGLITTPSINGPAGVANADEQHINLFSPSRLTTVFQTYVQEKCDARLDITGVHIHFMWRKT